MFFEYHQKNDIPEELMKYYLGYNPTEMSILDFIYYVNDIPKYYLHGDCSHVLTSGFIPDLFNDINLVTLLSCTDDTGEIFNGIFSIFSKDEKESDKIFHDIHGYTDSPYVYGSFKKMVTEIQK